MNDAIITCTNVYKTYYSNNENLAILKNINLAINQGESLAILGPSGSGKSTLLHLLGGLDKPTSGKILVNHNDWWSFSEQQRCQLRNQRLGFIYQFHHLLPEFSALENVAMPLLFANKSIKQARAQALSMLEQVNLSHRINHKPGQLSGGERQRVAVARALINQPQCILADELTGNLDRTTALTIFNLLLQLNQQANTAIIVVTHDQMLANKMQKTLTIVNGKILALP